MALTTASMEDVLLETNQDLEGSDRTLEEIIRKFEVISDSLERVNAKLLYLALCLYGKKKFTFNDVSEMYSFDNDYAKKLVGFLVEEGLIKDKRGKYYLKC